MGKTKRTIKELIGGKKTYLSKEQIAENKKLKGLTKKAKAKRLARKPYLKAGISETNLRALRPNLYKKEK